MAKRKLEVVITGDNKGARNAFNDTETRAGQFSSKLSDIGKKVGKGLALGAGALAVGVTSMVGAGLKDLVEVERIGAQTASVIESTGGAAGVAASEVAAYATALERKTGVEAENIQSGQNLLLTFTNVKNGVGAGNDIFNQATDIMTDMSVAMGTDASSTAIQLGKALNDPMKGITALSKVGVSFTDQQRAQIKAMTEAGDVAGAQKVILAELNKEFGGSAEAFGDTTAGKVAKLKNQWGDFQEEVASKVLPVLLKLGTWFQENLPKAIDKGKEVFVKIRPTIDSVVDKLGDVVDAVRPVVEAIGRFIKENPKPVFAALAVVIGGALVAALWALGSAMVAAFSPVVAVVAVVAALAAGLVWAYENVDWFRTAVQAVASFLTETLWPALKSVASFITETVVPAVVAIATKFGEIAATVGQKVTEVVGFVIGIPGRISSTVSGLWNGIKDGATGMADWVGEKVDEFIGFVKGIPGRITEQAAAILEAAKGLGTDILDGLGEGLSGVAGFVGDIATSISDAVKGAINTLIGLLNDGIPNKLGWGRLSIDIPDDPIPTLHTGGVFQAPTPGGEGLALLRDGERVMTPTQHAGRAADRGRSGGGDTYVTIRVHVAGSVQTERDLVSAIYSGFARKQKIITGGIN